MIQDLKVESNIPFEQREDLSPEDKRKARKHLEMRMKKSASIEAR
jgi:hypothetical protein